MTATPRTDSPEDPEREAVAAAAVRSAQLSVILMVAAAVFLTIVAILQLGWLVWVAGLVAFVGVGLLFFTGLQSGRRDAPKP